MTAHLINRREDLMLEALEGFELAHAHLVRLHRDPMFLTRRILTPGKVALVSGGGSGHEPLHTGFVGIGMLDAAVPGAVFSSPTSLQVRAAIDAVETGAGAVVIVKNYTGDVLNFSIAVDLLDDRSVETVVVDDDLATTATQDGGPGRRGTAAVIAVEKICGAAAEQGASLADVASLGREVVNRSATLSVAFEACVNPLTGVRSFELEDGQVEFGVGIHGERGIETRPAVGADDLVASMLDPIIDHLGLARGQQVLAIVNSLGATPPLEMAVATRAVHRILDSRGIGVARTMSGPFVTALDMHGVSVTLTAIDDRLVELWDAPVRTPGLTR